MKSIKEIITNEKDSLQQKRKITTEKKPKKLTQADKKLISAAVDIAETSPLFKDTGYLNKHLIQANLPHSRPKTDTWTRKNGNFTLGIQAGHNFETNKSYGLPYGSNPRLFLIKIITEAVKNKSRKIELGTSLPDFMRAIGKNPDNGTGKRSDYRMLMEQITRLIHAKFTFSETISDEKGREGNRWLNMQVSSGGYLWWDVKNPHQSNLFASWIELGEEFYNAIISSPVPIDFRACVALKQSPLAIDCYTWLCFEAYKANKSKKNRFVPFASLFKQMGGEYATQKDFTKNFKKAMKKALALAPNVHLEFVNGGAVVVSDSLPPINAQE